MTCAWCGAPVEAETCPACGRAVAPDSRDRVEVDLGHVAGISERGLRRTRNEDAVFVSAPGPDAAVAVVCDGVSSSTAGHLAAQVAADVAGAHLTTAAAAFGTRLAPETTAAVERAARAVEDLPRMRATTGPATTFVSVVRRADELAIGWVGDSRAYWIGTDNARLLTTDDTWAVHQQRSGRLSAREIAAAPQANSITGWLGADAPGGPPHVIRLRPSHDGRVVVCSDGLWHYLPTVGDLVSLVASAGSDATAFAVTKCLVDYAIAAGAKDNVTVAVLTVTAGGNHD